jgi:hypothetical protein
LPFLLSFPFLFPLEQHLLRFHLHLHFPFPFPFHLPLHFIYGGKMVQQTT